MAVAAAVVMAAKATQTTTAIKMATVIATRPTLMLSALPPKQYNKEPS